MLSPLVNKQHSQEVDRCSRAQKACNIYYHASL